MQAFAAILWVSYGLAIHAPPVVVANLIVAAIAICSSLRQPASNKPPLAAAMPEDESLS
ncbi:MAG: hypothetical protein ACRD9L_12515 [Bryobacteraceae bacterium]